MTALNSILAAGAPNSTGAPKNRVNSAASRGGRRVRNTRSGDQLEPHNCRMTLTSMAMPPSVIWSALSMLGATME